MIDSAMWAVTLASIIGTVANVHKRAWCFWIWGFTNTAWAVYDVHKTAYAQAALQTVYVGLAIWGIVSWRRRAE